MQGFKKKKYYYPTVVKVLAKSLRETSLGNCVKPSIKSLRVFEAATSKKQAIVLVRFLNEHFKNSDGGLRINGTAKAYFDSLDLSRKNVLKIFKGFEVPSKYIITKQITST